MFLETARIELATITFCDPHDLSTGFPKKEKQNALSCSRGRTRSTQVISFRTPIGGLRGDRPMSRALPRLRPKDSFEGEPVGELRDDHFVPTARDHSSPKDILATMLCAMFRRLWIPCWLSVVCVIGGAKFIFLEERMFGGEGVRG